jgi:hypothetical protein
MSYAETPPETFIKFDQNPQWRNSPKPVLTADFLSANGESNLLWTPFYYEEKDGKLYDPVREKFVAGSANGDKVEEGIITQLQEWFLTHESGIGVWISPKGDGVRPYFDDQITIYRIAYKNIDSDQPLQKVLMLSWHQFNTEFRNPEEIRQFIFTEDDNEESILKIIKWLKKVSQKAISDNCGDLVERREKAEYYADLYKSNTPMYELAYQMDQTGFLGKNPIGCPLNYSNSIRELTASNKIIEGTYCKNCGVCGAVIEMYITPGYTCKSCGEVYKGVC